MKIAYAGVMGGENGFTKAMREACDEFVDISSQASYMSILALEKADIVFLQPQDRTISVEALLHLKRIGAWVCHWIGDARDQTPAYCWEYAKYVDLTCFSNMRDVRNMRDAGYKSEFLQIGADNEIYYPDNLIEKNIDIVFFGNSYGHFPLSGLRAEMVKELKRAYGDRFKAYGINQPNGSFMGDQKGEADIYRRAKIGINLSHYDYERYTSDRMFRMLLSGVCVLSHFYKGIEEDFKGGDLIAWNQFDLEALKQAIDTLLNDEQRRSSISKQGHQLALNKYTFSSMAQNIVELYKQHKNG